MAVTKIWPVKSRLDHVLSYAQDLDKTENPLYEQAKGQPIKEVLHYAMEGEKTKEQFFVTGLNCSPDTAKEEMMITKKQFQKTGSILAFHAYQSFAYDEVTPAAAHEIGVQLAQELWGERFQVVVSTHLDKAHLHNHFVLNSVSFMDGKRYYDNHQTYGRMRAVSDRLCKEYQLSVIEAPQTGRRYPSYGAYLAKQDGKPTWDSEIMADLEAAITSSRTMQQFFYQLQEMGYERKQRAQYFTIRPPGKERFVRIDRRHPEYTLDAIKMRILEQGNMPHGPIKNSRYENSRLQQHTNTCKSRIISGKKPKRKIGGLRGFYLHYCYLLGILPKHRKIETRSLPLFLREDIQKLNQISQETKLLCRNRIDTPRQLQEYQKQLTEKEKMLLSQRKRLYNQSQRGRSPEKQEGIREEIATLTNSLSNIRREKTLCKTITERSVKIQEKIHFFRVQTHEKRGKEKDEHEYIR